MKRRLITFSLLFFISFNYVVAQTEPKIIYHIIKDSSDNGSSYLFFVEQFGSYKIKYPKRAYKKNIQGIVIITFDLDDNCRIKNKHVIKKLGYGLDKEALRFFKILQRQIETEPKNTCFEAKGLELAIKFKIK